MMISSLSFSGVAPVSATLSLDAGTPNVTNVIALCWDTAERGADFSAWANHRYLAYAPPETTSVTLAFPDAVTSGWNASVRAARFFLVDGTPYIPDASAYVSDGLLDGFRSDAVSFIVFLLYLSSSVCLGYCIHHGIGYFISI